MNIHVHLITVSLTLKVCHDLDCLQNPSEVSEFSFPSGPDGLWPLFYDEPSKLVIMTIYNCSYIKSMEEQRILDISETILSISYPSWILIISFLASIYVLIRSHFSIHVHDYNQNGLWNIFTFVILQPCMKDINWNSRCISYILSMFVFWVVICYVLGMVQSDKVSMYVPNIFHNQDDILNEVNLDLWVDSYYRQMDGIKELVSHAKGVNGHVDRVTNVLKLFDPLQKNRLLIYINDLLRSTQLLICLPGYRVHGVCFHISRNNLLDNDIEFIRYMSTKFKGNPSFGRYMKYSKWSFQMGIKLYELKELRGLNDVTVPNDCTTNDIVTYDPEYEPYSVVNYKYALLFILMVLFLSLPALRLEHFKMGSMLRNTFPKVRNVKKRKRVGNGLKVARI